MEKKDVRILYCCEEFAFPGIASSGGLGVLSADFIQSCIELGYPVEGVGLYHSKGNVHQALSDDGWQSDYYDGDIVKPPIEHGRIIIPTPEGNIEVKSRDYQVHSTIPGEEEKCGSLHLLYDVGNNIVDVLYPGHNQKEKTLNQEIILGMGAAMYPHEFGHENIKVIHINESHAALASLVSDRDIVFTTHTNVEAGIERYTNELARKVLGYSMLKKAHSISGDCSELHMMKLAMASSVYSFGVSPLQMHTARYQFRDYPGMGDIDSIDNGVHLRWIAKEIQNIYDRITGGESRKDPKVLEDKIDSIPDDEFMGVHKKLKKDLADFLNTSDRVRGNCIIDPENFTIGFARRASLYKRLVLLLEAFYENPKILDAIGNKINLVFAGKSHPEDLAGKELIRNVFSYMNEFRGRLNIKFILDYDVEVAKLMVSGVDAWLNTPEMFMEASGTSGMKAGGNGVPSISKQDGWWVYREIEGYRFPKGCVEGRTGWGIGKEPLVLDLELLQKDEKARALREKERRNDKEELINKLNDVIYPTWKSEKDWVKLMKGAASNFCHFNSHRMTKEYFKKAYGIEV